MFKLKLISSYALVSVAAVVATYRTLEYVHGKLPPKPIYEVMQQPGIPDNGVIVSAWLPDGDAGFRQHKIIFRTGGGDCYLTRAWVLVCDDTQSDRDFAKHILEERLSVRD